MCSKEKLECSAQFYGIGTRISNSNLSEVWTSLQKQLLSNKPMPKIDAFMVNELEFLALTKVCDENKFNVEGVYWEYGSKLPPKVASFYLPALAFRDASLADFLVFVRSEVSNLDECSMDQLVCLVYELLIIYRRGEVLFD